MNIFSVSLFQQVFFFCFFFCLMLFGTMTVTFQSHHHDVLVQLSSPHLKTNTHSWYLFHCALNFLLVVACQKVNKSCGWCGTLSALIWLKCCSMSPCLCWHVQPGCIWFNMISIWNHEVSWVFIKVYNDLQNTFLIFERQNTKLLLRYSYFKWVL